MKKKVLVVGAGMAGLSAGAYLQMNGFEVHLFELNATPGGVCTSWKRGDYTVDWCIHWLVGSGSTNSFYDRWNELIDMRALEIIDHETYAVTEDEHGNRLHVYTDLDRLEAHWLDFSPEDADKIRAFVHACKRFTGMDMPSEHTFETGNLWFKMRAMWKMLPFMGALGQYSRMSCAEYAEGFRHPLLRKTVANLFEPEIPVLFVMMTLAWMHNKEAGYPIGGSLLFARRIADRLTELGGQIHYRSRVEKILVENNRAVGIRLSDGTEYRGDYVVSAADGHATIFDLLEHRYTNVQFEKMFTSGQTFPSLIFLSAGVARTFNATPHTYLFPLKTPLHIDPETELRDLLLRVHNFDPTLAPPGKTLLSAMIETRNWAYWVDLQKNDPEQYAAEKKRLVEGFIDALDDKLGDVRDLVEMTDVVTPATIIGFTNNWKGSFEGWLATPETGFGQLQNTLDGLENCYLCGHWVAPGGGVPTAMMSGRTAAEQICLKEGLVLRVSS